MIIKGSLSGKTNAFPNLINNGTDVDKTYLYAKDWKYQLLINKRENSDLKYFNDSKAFVEYSYDMDAIYKILKNIIQIKNEKYWLYLMIWLLIYFVTKNLIQ